MILGNIVMINIIAGIVLILVVLALSLLTISKGYGFKHTIDPLPDDQKSNHAAADEKQEEERTGS